AVSASGNTEETVEAAQAAEAAGAKLVVLSSGGTLGAMAEASGAPHVRIPEIAMPRAGVGNVSIPALLVLERVGLLPGASEQVAAAIDQLKRRRDKLIQDGSSAHRAAATIGRTMPIAYGGEALGEVAAYRFKCQVN